MGMIWSEIAHWEEEKRNFADAIRRGMDYIVQNDIFTMELGKHLIEGELLFALIQETTTKEFQLQKPESHRQYIDIQYLVSGEEKIGVAKLSSSQLVTEDFFETKDVAFYGKLQNELELILHPGAYAVFFPTDIHRPCCTVKADRKIRKAVIKIHTSLIDP
jgi:biofilm protein TabA